jgi:hypothetical protein
VKIIGGVTAVTMTTEIAIIALQAGRGVRSHFNVATTFDAALFTVMGAAILVATLAGVAGLVLLFLRKTASNALTWALRMGLFVSILGATLGGAMTRPRPEQLERLQKGVPSYAGAHSVGVDDGGRGLPLVGWSTEGGDLRVPHFVGLHALQILPLFGAWVVRARARRRFSEWQRTRFVIAAAVGYFGVYAALTWQALRGEPVIAPGALTITSFVVVFSAALAVAGSALMRLRRTSASSAPPHQSVPRPDVVSW